MRVRAAGPILPSLPLEAVICAFPRVTHICSTMLQFIYEASGGDLFVMQMLKG